MGNFEGGGAEHVMRTLANAWDERGLWRIRLIVLDDHPIERRLVSSGVEVIQLGLISRGHNPASPARFSRLLYGLRQAVSGFQADVALSFLTEVNIVTILSLLGSGIPVVVSERIAFSNPQLSRAWKTLRALAYPLAHAIVAQSAGIRASLPARLQRRVHVIPNPVPAVDWRDEVPTNVSRADSGRLVVALGRLTPQKGFDVLIPAFAEAARKVAGWKLAIHGEGPERDRLEGLVRSLGVSHIISLPGWSSDPLGILGRADVFVLPSRFEGQSNALIEAMAVGKPCVVTRCPGANEELVMHQENGLLVAPDNEAELAAALERLMTDERLRRALGERAQRIANAFPLDSVLSQWDSVLMGVRDSRQARSFKREAKTR